MEPFSSSAIFAGIHSAFRFAEFAVRIAEVGTENEVFVRTIQVVRNDLNEAQRLISVQSVQKKLIGNPAKLDWIKAAIHSSRNALYEIGRWVERARVDQQATGTVRWDTRVRWVFNDHEKLLNRQTELSTCHQQLSNVLAYLTPLEEIVIPSKPSIFDHTTDFENLVSPWQRRKQSLPKSYDMGSKENRSTCIPKSSEVSKREQLDYQHPAPLPHRESFTTQHSLTSHLSSLPPTYESATKFIYPTNIYNEDHGTPKSSEQRLPSVQATSIHAQDAKSAEIYAYMDPQYGDNSGGNHDASWCMSGTNHLGPVDPLGLFPELPGATSPDIQATLQPVEPNIREICELFGDLSFPIELPTNTPGPPPGYPRPASKTSLPRRPINSTLQPTASISDSRASDVLHELPSAHYSTRSVPSCSRSELPGSVSSAFCPVSSISLPEHNSRPMDGRSAGSSEVNLAHPQTISSKRMQRQKMYMDMLGSIEQR
ncbi:hypothetical protein BDW02DRAFT_40101 [Decorospora gaudefroyi]|uniref:Fungal N-terminal domain-containing protein n=1 Tax=Decorospora gaudefroyi TaxID=184978 RepID=A0A6A5KED4_9PLEO|nr:hypothetical protein BDW02DRAFT_40101 [Decorospora gaudefroyi]